MYARNYRNRQAVEDATQNLNILFYFSLISGTEDDEGYAIWSSGEYPIAFENFKMERILDGYFSSSMYFWSLDAFLLDFLSSKSMERYSHVEHHNRIGNCLPETLTRALVI